MTSTTTQVAKRGGIPLLPPDGHRARRCATTARPMPRPPRSRMAVAKGERTLTEAEADAVNLVPDDLRGLDRFEARKRVVEQITAEGLAVMTPPTDPRLGTSRRSPSPPKKAARRATTTAGAAGRGQADHAALRRPLQGRDRADADRPVVRRYRARSSARRSTPCAIGDVEILPERDKKVYFHWLENIEPWCISRQLWWGHQIPVWYAPSPRRAASEWHHVCAASEVEAARAAARDAAARMPSFRVDGRRDRGCWSSSALS